MPRTVASVMGLFPTPDYTPPALSAPMAGLLILDAQHAGKPGRWRDRGAVADLDGDGRIAVWEQEAYLTPLYAYYAAMAAQGRGWDVVTISDGAYADRHRRANAYAAQYGRRPVVYVACHLNAGGGDYGLVLHDHKSSAGNGPALAASVAHALAGRCPELRRTVVDGASPDRWANGFYTIKGAGQPVALCYEPCFIDNPDHQPMLDGDGLQRIGEALVDGVLAWAAKTTT